MLRSLLLISPLLFTFAVPGKQPPSLPSSPRERLQALGDLVGSWRGTGAPFGTRDEQQKNFWVETLTCGWKFKGNDAWLVLAFEKSTHFKFGELRYRADADDYRLVLKTVDDRSLTVDGTLKENVLTLVSADAADRLVITFLHDNRFLYRQDIRPEGKTSYKKLYQVGATREGVPFAAGGAVRECVVTSGLGTSTVTYQGKTYYVCCSGCRDEFMAEPAKYVREFEAKKAKK